jgi:hypothetical protein
MRDEGTLVALLVAKSGRIFLFFARIEGLAAQKVTREGQNFFCMLNRMYEVDVLANLGLSIGRFS